jgi:hypothetical protein
MYRVARAELLKMLGAHEPKPALRLVDGEAPSEIAHPNVESVKIPRLRPLERRRLAASS